MPTPAPTRAPTAAPVKGEAPFGRIAVFRRPNRTSGQKCTYSCSVVVSTCVRVRESVSPAVHTIYFQISSGFPNHVRELCIRGCTVILPVMKEHCQPPPIIHGRNCSLSDRKRVPYDGVPSTSPSMLSSVSGSCRPAYGNLVQGGVVVCILLERRCFIEQAVDTRSSFPKQATIQQPDPATNTLFPSTFVWATATAIATTCVWLLLLDRQKELLCLPPRLLARLLRLP